MTGRRRLGSRGAARLSRIHGRLERFSRPIVFIGMMKYTETLKKNHQFRRLYDRGKSAVTPYLVVYTRKNQLRKNRVGFTVSTKLGNAVTRNRVRRRLRELYRTHEAGFRTGRDLVIVARTRAVGAPYAALERALLSASEKLSLLREEAPQT